MEMQKEQERPVTSVSSAPESGTERDTTQAGSDQPRAQESRRSEPPRRESTSGASAGPFSMMRRFGDEIDRMFDDFYHGIFRSDERWPFTAWPKRARDGSRDQTWWPAVEVYERDNKLVVQADVPGLKKDDVRVEVRGDKLCISGERRSETEQKERGYYRSERSYGSFNRTVTLPEGARPETASASFENGVLRIEMEAPKGAEQGRQIEIREGATH